MLTKENNKWIIVDIDTDTINALTFGLVDGIEDMWGWDDDLDDVDDWDWEDLDDLDWEDDSDWEDDLDEWDWED